MDLENPGLVLLVIIPAVAVLVAGLALRRGLPVWTVGLVAAPLTGLGLALASLVADGELAAFLRLTFAAFVWTILTLPGALLGMATLFAARHLPARAR